MATLTPEIEKLALLQATKFLRAYLECSDEIQAGIRDMLVALSDPSIDEDDRDMALITLADALFPDAHAANPGMSLEGLEEFGTEHSEEVRTANAEMDREEEIFAARLRIAMKLKGITQEQLAAKIGVGQPAISNMLNRQCRRNGELWFAWRKFWEQLLAIYGLVSRPNQIAGN